MATETEVVNSLNDYLRTKGYTCGRNFASVGDVTKAIAANMPGETHATLEPKVRKAILTPTYGFKTRSNGDEVSASDPPRCGSD